MLFNKCINIQNNFKNVYVVLYIFMFSVLNFILINN